MIEAVRQYYSQKLAEHGATPKGVDWNGLEGQTLRFHQLSRILDTKTPFSVCDFGCGYGALYDHLVQRGVPFSYIGVDISEGMVDAARNRRKVADGAEFRVGDSPVEADYVIGSGVFNVRLSTAADAGSAYVRQAIIKCYAAARKGCAFNLLTAHADAERMRPDLHYEDPGEMLDFCLSSVSRHVTLVHDYPLFEFTILVRRAPWHESF